MNRIYWLIVPGLMMLAGPRIEAATGEPPLRVHFVGANAIQNHREALVLRDIAKLEEGGPVFQLIAGLFAGRWSANLGIPTTVEANLLAGAVAEILRAEIHFELVSPEDGNWRLAANLPADKAKAAQEAIQDHVGGGKAVLELQVDAKGSWRFTPVKTKRTTHVSYQRGWLVIDSSGEVQPSAWRKQLIQDGKIDLPTGALGAVSVKASVLRGMVPRLQYGHPFDLNLVGKIRNGTPRIEGSIDFQKPMKLELQDFMLPTNTLRDPMISFTAVRGISGLLERLPELKQWRLPAYPNQLIAWTEADKPVYTTLAAPMKGAGRWFNKQIPRFEESLGLLLETKKMGTVRYMTNHAAVVWRGLPMIAPFISTNALEKDWVFSATFPGFLPKGAITNPPPAQLLSQIKGRPELIFYHWEVGEPRVQQMQMLASLGSILVRKRAPLPGNPLPGWIKAMQDRLGNTITEVTRGSDRQWKIVRSGTIGLTAAELTILAQWLTPTKALPDLPLPPGLQRK